METVLYDLKEEWKPLKYKNVKPMYSVSNYGGLKNTITNTILHPWKSKGNGYIYASLMCTDNKVLHVGMHVLVATHFIIKPKSDEILVPNHKNFDRTDNFVKNLEWVTYRENNEWNILNGHYKSCEKAQNAKSTNLLVHKICRMMRDGYLNRDIMKELNLDSSDSYYKNLLSGIRTGHKWKDISSLYDITNRNTLRKNDLALVKSICDCIEIGMELKDIRKSLDISDDDKEKFKKLVWFIRKRKIYKEISENYTWWKYD